MKALRLKLAAMLGIVAFATGCATTQPYDYSAYKQSRPRSILILPPVNNSPDVNATNGMYSQTMFPLAEAGYYVFPASLVSETFKQNGLTSPAEIHLVAPKKLREIFGADSALYLTVTKYGSSYMLLKSSATVAADAKLVDLKTGSLLWQGSATASSDEGQGNSGGGLVGALVSAAVAQVVNNLTDASYKVAGTTNERLLAGGRPNGVLYGPRSPKYGTD